MVSGLTSAYDRAATMPTPQHPQNSYQRISASSSGQPSARTPFASHHAHAASFDGSQQSPSQPASTTTYSQSFPNGPVSNPGYARSFGEGAMSAMSAMRAFDEKPQIYTVRR